MMIGGHLDVELLMNEILDGQENIEKIEKMNSLQDDKNESDDELEQYELKEEHYLKVDAVAKQQFQYNRNVAYSNDFPELQVKVQNDPISLAPGEGMVYFQYNVKVILILIFKVKFLSAYCLTISGIRRHILTLTPLQRTECRGRGTNI